MANNAIIQKMMDIEYLPPAELVNSKIDVSKAQKFPIEKAAGLGLTFQPLTQLSSFAAGGAGKSGIYFVNTAGKTMFKSGREYIGSLKALNGRVGGGAARLTQLPIDPTMLCMAVAIMAIEKKLDAIYQAQKDILAFLELQEEAKLKGNLNALADILNNYKFNWDNEKYKEHKHILVQDIKRETEQSIILYREQLQKTSWKNSLLHSNQEVKSFLKTALHRLNDYQLALYTFSFSSFLEVMLLENFDTNYLNSIANKVQEYSDTYKQLYKQYTEIIEKTSNTSVEGYALKGLSKLSSTAGKLVEKIPVISKSQLDENLLKAGDLLQDKDAKRTESLLQVLTDSRTDYASSFIENIHILDTLYNHSMQLLFDEENIYIAEAVDA